MGAVYGPDRALNMGVMGRSRVSQAALKAGGFDSVVAATPVGRAARAGRGWPSIPPEGRAAYLRDGEAVRSCAAPPGSGAGSGSGEIQHGPGEAVGVLTRGLVSVAQVGVGLVAPDDRVEPVEIDG